MSSSFVITTIFTHMSSIQQYRLFISYHFQNLFPLKTIQIIDGLACQAFFICETLSWTVYLKSIC